MLPAAAQTNHNLAVYFDVDNDPGTRCAAQAFQGAEERVRITL